MYERVAVTFTMGKFPGLVLVWGLEGFPVFILIPHISHSAQRVAPLLSRTRRAWSAGAQHSLVRTRLWCGRRGWLQSPVPTSLGIPIPSRNCEADGHFLSWYYAIINAAQGSKHDPGRFRHGMARKLRAWEARSVGAETWESDRMVNVLVQLLSRRRTRSR